MKPFKNIEQNNRSILEVDMMSVPTGLLSNCYSRLTELVDNYDGVVLKCSHEGSRLPSNQLVETMLSFGRKLKMAGIPFAVVPLTSANLVVGKGMQAVCKAEGGYFNTKSEARDYIDHWHKLNEKYPRVSIYRED